MKQDKRVILVYCCIHEELVRKFKVGGIIKKDWFFNRFLGSEHHIQKNLRPPILKEMINLKLVKRNDKYKKGDLEICKPIIDLENTSRIYRQLNFF